MENQIDGSGLDERAPVLGDRVRVLAGAFAGLLGTVTEADEFFVRVALDSTDMRIELSLYLAEVECLEQGDGCAT